MKVNFIWTLNLVVIFGELCINSLWFLLKAAALKVHLLSAIHTHVYYHIHEHVSVLWS